MVGRYRGRGHSVLMADLCYCIEEANTIQYCCIAEANYPPIKNKFKKCNLCLSVYYLTVVLYFKEKNAWFCYVSL